MSLRGATWPEISPTWAAEPEDQSIDPRHGQVLKIQGAAWPRRECFAYLRVDDLVRSGTVTVRLPRMGKRGQTIKLQSVMRCTRHLAAITAMGLAVGLIVVPLDAAPRRLVPVPRPRPVTAGDRSSVPLAA